MVCHTDTPFGIEPHEADAGWARPEAGGYLVYRGMPATADIDWTAAVAVAQAGSAIAYVQDAAQAPDRPYHYGLRAVSDAGIEEAGTECVCRAILDAEGLLTGDAPNALVSAGAEAAEAGDLTVWFVYARRGERAVAASVQIAEVVAGSPQWDSPVATISLAARGITRHEAALGESYSHGQTVRLALRAITAGGVGGPVTTLRPIAADAEAPADVDYLEVEQV